MAVIIPPDSFYKKKPNTESKKLYIYFKKEIELSNEKDITFLLNVIRKFYKEGLFDDIYISRSEIEDVQKIKDIYTISVLNDMKYVKEEINTLKDVVKRLISVVKQLKFVLEEYNK